MPLCSRLCAPQGSVARTSEGAALDLGLSVSTACWHQAPEPAPIPAHTFPQPRGLQRPRLKTHRHTGIETLFSAISVKESRPPVWIRSSSQQCWAQGWTIRYVPEFCSLGGSPLLLRVVLGGLRVNPQPTVGSGCPCETTRKPGNHVHVSRSVMSDSLRPHGL